MKNNNLEEKNSIKAEKKKIFCGSCGKEEIVEKGDENRKIKCTNCGNYIDFNYGKKVKKKNKLLF